MFRGKKPKAVLDDISFYVSEGEIIGLIGKNGCGKSTIAKILARLIDPDSGKILFRGKDITHLQGHALQKYYRQVQMVFQSPSESFDPRRTVGYSICENLRTAGVPKVEVLQRANTLLARCGLPSDIAERYPHQVSGGQAQRAQIARALMPSPSLLICDEATSALDATVQVQILALLKEVQQESSLAMIFISHNLALVQNFCNRVLVMDSGKIVETGSPYDIVNHPRNELTKELLRIYE